jgi:hypothetical protein
MRGGDASEGRRRGSLRWRTPSSRSMRHELARAIVVDAGMRCPPAELDRSMAVEAMIRSRL